MLKVLIKILKEIKFFFSSLNILIASNNIKPKIVFFSENKVYQKFSKPLIDAIISSSSDQIFYFSINKDDMIENERVTNYFVSPLLLNFVFSKLKAENIFLTVTDLGNNVLKKTNLVNKYIYYFHSPVSTTKNYTPQAFDNYDVILCNGKFQVNEIRLRESLKKINKKKLIPTGYFYFDYLVENINHNIYSDEVLIAPSWNKNMKNFINEDFIELIDIMIKKNYKVIFRPHPEHFKRSKVVLEEIKRKFSKSSLRFDESTHNIKSMQSAKCLITDSSGIAIEYMIALKRPVLYLDEHDKIHNTEFQDYLSLMTIDQQIKENFGTLFKKKDFNEIESIIENSEKVFKKKLPGLISLISENFYNFGNSKKFLKSNLKDII